MLFVESRTAERGVVGARRIAVLDRLQDAARPAHPLASRLYCFEQADGARTARANSNASSPVPIPRRHALRSRRHTVLLDDFAPFFVFGDAARRPLRAVIVSKPGPDEPYAQARSLCHSVRSHRASRTRVRDKDCGGPGLKPLARPLEWLARGGIGGYVRSRFSSSVPPPRGSRPQV